MSIRIVNDEKDSSGRTIISREIEIPVSFRTPGDVRQEIEQHISALINSAISMSVDEACYPVDKRTNGYYHDGVLIEELGNVLTRRLHKRFKISVAIIPGF